MVRPGLKLHRQGSELVDADGGDRARKWLHALSPVWLTIDRPRTIQTIRVNERVYQKRANGIDGARASEQEPIWFVEGEARSQDRIHELISDDETEVLDVAIIERIKVQITDWGDDDPLHVDDQFSSGVHQGFACHKDYGSEFLFLLSMPAKPLRALIDRLRDEPDAGLHLTILVNSYYEEMAYFGDGPFNVDLLIPDRSPAPLEDIAVVRPPRPNDPEPEVTENPTKPPRHPLVWPLWAIVGLLFLLLLK